ncbi:hypothetical protein [Streptomyces sp.]|uniref:hypothetical protein n=1 Tax=Streptomyces sp. TaxID=1931 RepID=UPI002F91F230
MSSFGRRAYETTPTTAVEPSTAPRVRRRFHVGPPVRVDGRAAVQGVVEHRGRRLGLAGQPVPRDEAQHSVSSAGA